MSARVTGRGVAWVAAAGPREVGPPSPVRRSKSGESGEWVTEPAPRQPPAPPPGRRPPRAAHS